MRRELEKVRQLESEGIRVVLLAEIEDEFGLGAMLIGGGHERGDEILKRGRIRAEDGRQLSLLLRLKVSRRLGGHGSVCLSLCV